LDAALPPDTRNIAFESLMEIGNYMRIVSVAFERTPVPQTANSPAIQNCEGALFLIVRILSALKLARRILGPEFHKIEGVYRSLIFRPNLDHHREPQSISDFVFQPFSIPEIQVVGSAQYPASFHSGMPSTLRQS
jgi:hypothetical protein